MTRVLAEQRHEQGGNFAITARWTPGHEGVEGNELADKVTKDAAEGSNKTSKHQEKTTPIHSERTTAK